MADKVVTESVQAELFRESDTATIHHVRMKVSIKEYTPDQATSPVKRFVIGHEPAKPFPTLADGRDYVLRYTCSAGPFTERGRYEKGLYRAGR